MERDLRFLRKERYKRKCKRKKEREIDKSRERKSCWMGQCFIMTDVVTMLRNGEAENINGF